MNGVSTYLALIFGTLLSSQGTNASFVLTHRDNLRGFPPGASLRFFPTLPDPFSVPFPVGIVLAASWKALPIRLPCGSLSASPTLSEVFDRTDRPLFSENSGASPEVTSGKRIDVNRCHRTCPVPRNYVNLPPHTFRVNGIRGTKRRVAARPECPHIRRPSVRRRCAPPPRRRPWRRHVQRDRPGHRRTQGRPAQRRCRG